MDRHTYLSRIFDHLEELSSREYQQRYWFTEDPQSVFSFPEEAIERGIGDLNVIEALDNPKWAFTHAQKSAARELDRLLNEFCKRYPGPLDPHEVFNNPDWDNIRTAAQKFRDLIGADLDDAPPGPSAP